MTPPKPVKPVRCYALVNAMGKVLLLDKVSNRVRRWKSDKERIIRGRFVPDVKKARITR